MKHLGLYPTLLENYHQWYKKMQKIKPKYFKKFSDFIADLLDKAPENIAKHLIDPLFIKCFHQICKKNKINEYNLLDKQGNFLLLDKTGNRLWLLVRNSDEMTATYYTAQWADEAVPFCIIKDLEYNRKILHIPAEGNISPNPAEWQPYLYPATKIKGTLCAYYYSLIKEPTPRN